MSGILPSLAVAAGPIAKRVLAAIGVGVISYAAITHVVHQIIGHVQSNYSQIPATIYQILNIAGFNTAFGIILGAIVARASLMAIKRLGVLST